MRNNSYGWLEKSSSKFVHINLNSLTLHLTPLYSISLILRNFLKNVFNWERKTQVLIYLSLIFVLLYVWQSPLHHITFNRQIRGACDDLAWLLCQEWEWVLTGCNPLSPSSHSQQYWTSTCVLQTHKYTNYSPRQIRLLFSPIIKVSSLDLNCPSMAGWPWTNFSYSRSYKQSIKAPVQSLCQNSKQFQLSWFSSAGFIPMMELK